MTSILDLPDDVLFAVLMFTTPPDLFSVSDTCSHFRNLSDRKKYPPVNKYWQQQCKCLWTLVETNNFTPQNYDYKCLFESMVDFITIEKMSHTVDMAAISKTRKLAQNIELRMDDTLATMANEICGLLGSIIYQDNLEMFKVYTCNMTANDIRMYRVVIWYQSNSLLFGVIEHASEVSTSTKIAKYLLAPIQIKDKHNGNIISFPNIDIHSVNLHGSCMNTRKDTPLGHASYHRHVEIVSLLINHPNMTKDGINKAGSKGLTPLHCACDKLGTDSHGKQNDGVKIAQMLIDDERTDVNAVDFQGKTPLMYAIKSQPKIAPILIENDKVDVNIQSHCGNTALHVAVEFRDIYCGLIKKLLSRKDFDKNIVNNQGKTGLDLAKENPWMTRIVSMLTDC